MAEILDSGNRREFESGAVRDVAEGKGRCDLLPLDVCGRLLGYYYGNSNRINRCNPLESISFFLYSLNSRHIYDALINFSHSNSWEVPTMLLEVSKHFEDGARKYGDRNWEKGIPAHCYVDSAVRHYLKWADEKDDERHDRAFCWNLLCLLWTIWNKPECDDLPDYDEEDKDES